VGIVWCCRGVLLIVAVSTFETLVSFWSSTMSDIMCHNAQYTEASFVSPK
jgi:hypothetical protein